MDRWHRVSCVLFLIDLQPALLNVIPQSERLLFGLRKTVQFSDSLGLQRIVTEQYPKGLGKTDPRLGLQASQKIIEKTAFSAGNLPEVIAALETMDQPQCILTGIETHVCVLQTAFDLLRRGYRVMVLSDGVSSRKNAEHECALAEMARQGVAVRSFESWAFEILEDASSPDFKKVKELFR